MSWSVMSRWPFSEFWWIIGLIPSLEPVQMDIDAKVRGIALQGKRAFSETEFCVANNASDDENKLLHLVQKFLSVSVIAVNIRKMMLHCQAWVWIFGIMLSQYLIQGDKADSQDAENSYHYRDDVQRSPRAVMLSNNINMKNDSLAQENLMSCPVAGDGFTIGNSNNELIRDLPNALSDIYSHGMTSELPDRIITEFTAVDDVEPVDEVIKNQGQVSEFAPNHGHIGDFVPVEMSREDPQGGSQAVVSQSNAGASNLAAFNQSPSLRSPPIIVGQVTIGTSSESQGGTNVESNNELHEKSGSPKDSDTTQRVIEAQLDGPNMNKTNSRVLDESSGFSNQNDVAESGCQRLDRLETNSRTVKGEKVIGQDNEAYGFVLQPLRWSKGSQNICSDQDLPASNQSLRILKSS
ncbi:hypothetical protein KIW84_056226 [Lathyrus oleraceus]|uniref:Uncharacterized protein n=1 Tax=Pisum sativum TaxID=3888 RepID=A0A9D4X067_PEA|nr:hypothetical protein KIW84_056226 [Pisum sativum]